MLHYFDAILIYSQTFEEHLTDLTRVLDSLRLHGLTAKSSRTELAFDKLAFLGHRVGGGYTEPDDSNLSKILIIKIPATRRQVRQIFGLLNYHHTFIKNYSQLTSPLADLLRGPIRKNIPLDRRS